MPVRRERRGVHILCVFACRERRPHMNVSQLFPPCHIDDCPQAGNTHHHVLPHQQELLDSAERIVALVGGYGCLGPETVVGGVPIAERRAGDVQTLEGPSCATAPFRKGRTALYRVTIQSGREVVATLDHQFLTHVGWRPLGSLAVGVCIAIGEDGHGQLETAAGGDSRGCCSDNLRQRDGQLLPSRVAAQDRWLRSATTGVASIPRLVWPDRPSTEDSVGHACFGCRVGHARTTETAAPSLQIHEERVQSLGKFLPRGNVEPRRTTQVERVVDDDAGYGHGLDRLVCSYPPVSQGWDPIVKVTFARYGEFWDLSVPGPEHYLAQGIWHHN